MGQHHHHHHHGHHHHGHHHHDHNASKKNIVIAFVLNFLFTIIELVGGYMTGSVAVLSDALHDAGDTLSLGLALFLEHKSQEGPSPNFSYGKRRLSLLSAVITGIVITVGGTIILWEAVPRIWNPGEPQGLGMMGLAVLGIAMNGFAAWRLSRGGSTQNEKVLTWHLMEDAMGWGAVLVGGAMVHFFKLYWIDPLLATLISLFIIYNVLKELNRSIGLLLQASPNPDGLSHFIEDLKKQAGIQGVHDVHYWSLDGAHHVLSLHVVSGLVGQELIDLKIKIRALTESIGSPHTTIEVESTNEDCTDHCD